ncbi:MAG TPA: macro domain-containing protein [Fimbriimonadaceae bacterium]|nr:macro domain-containing protein [Fimbriimonadaceae bacterium]
MPIEVVEGDLLDQDVEVIVNPWNRNTIPWWLLLPQGVSGAIKRRGGLAPFRELAKHGRLALGQAVMTGPGRLPFRAIIHVAGINDFWRAGERSVRDSTLNAVALARREGFASIAFPVIGSGSGGFGAKHAEETMLRTLEGCLGDDPLRVRIVRYRRK